MAHNKAHPRRGEVIPVLINGHLVDFEVEDWADRISKRAGQRWADMVYGRILNDADNHDVPTSRLLPNDALQVRHA